MEKIVSRFGEITVDAGKSLLFPRGLLGMPDKLRYALAKFPSARMQQFTMLQSLDDHALSFITLPLELQNGILAVSDVQAACRDLQISEANLALLLIVTVHRGASQVRVSVNARAPLFIDAERRVGAQYVFLQDHYKVQHML
ncbi:MAG: flagellar assembly protein FliW [Pseudomonadota bacterium]|nr:flagellar assembly protein FliW [Pseudomonadota bacterium]MDE3037453.1 flagellar assembly protein FliW [Pseudomonadota bacterium]